MRIVFLLLFCTFVSANERILDFHSRIQVLDNGNIHVTESIKVQAENRRIRHGIYRSTPTIYFGIFFTQHNSKISIINTKLDGNDVEHHTERLLNGIRVYLGSKSSFVSRGVHTYQIEYIADGQVVDLENTDGIYWNVTGNQWDFQIDHASVDVYLPLESSFIKQDAWTGSVGSEQQNYSKQAFNDHIHFETTMPLFQKQGFTIQTTWEKGFITNPDSKTWSFIKDNILWFFSIIMLLWFPFYYFLTWKRVGIDPPKTPIFARFEPPNKISPAAVRFITNKYYDGKCFSCAMMNLAVKNYVNIEQKSAKEYVFTKLERQSQVPMSKGESKIYHFLFNKTKKFTLSNSYSPRTKNAYNSLELKLEGEYKDACYMDNNKYWYFGVGLSLLALFFNWGHFFNFSNYAVSFFAMPAVAIILSAFGIATAKKLAMKWLAIIVPAGVTLAGLIAQTEKIYIAYIIVTLVILLVNALFYYLIQAPTVFGRKTLDKIAGFKLYLDTAEQDRLELLHPPTMTPELFEEYLPYALALGVENSWSEQFSNAMKVQGKDMSSYHPDWYVGNNNYSNFNYSSVASSIGSGLASSVVSAATPPAPSGSGGFGGGGFTGGGGGGGGGGGW